jgi:hypothetical protein
MRFLILSVIMLLLGTLLSVSIAEASPKMIKAGADSSGGGKSVVCREGNSPEGKILSIEMLDIYEARAMYGLEPAELGSGMRDILQEVKGKLRVATAIGNGIADGIDHLTSRLRILPPGTRIEPVNDASPIALPRGCALEQTAVWVDRGLVVADHEHWEAMNERNRAALIVHEVVYDFTRRFGMEKNSRRARKVVAHAFSQFQFEDVEAGMPANEKRGLCYTLGDNTAESTSFWIYANENNELVAQLLSFEGRYLFSRNTAVFKYLKYGGENSGPGHHSASVDSNFETESSLNIKWDPSKPRGERIILVLLDERGRRVEVRMGCIGLSPSVPGEEK